MKLTQYFRRIGLAVILGFGAVEYASAQSVTDVLARDRLVYQAERDAFVMKGLQLTEEEGAAFLPLYRSYRMDMEELGDSLVKLVLEYADMYPNVPEARGRQLLKDYSALEEKLVKKRAWYLKRAAKNLSAGKVLRWAQLENRIDLALRLQLAGAIPMAPATESKP